MPSSSWPERFARQVEVHAAGQGVGDDEGRRGEVVGLHLGMDARLEVAVPGEDGADDEVALVHGRGDLAGSGPEFPMQVVQP